MRLSASGAACARQNFRGMEAGQKLGRLFIARPNQFAVGPQSKRVQKNIDRRTSPWDITITKRNKSNVDKTN